MTDSTGNFPEAVSAESIKQSAESKTAVATSDASARVGEGDSTIESSIWVATTTGIPKSLHDCTIFFCIIGTSSGGISTPKSPRATIAASQCCNISSIFFIAIGFSNLAIIPVWFPTYFFKSFISLAFCTNERAM